MWKLRIEYGERAWLEARPYTVTISTKFPEGLRLPYALIHALSRILFEESVRAPEGQKGDHIAGALGAKGFHHRFSRLLGRHRVTVTDKFVIDLGWLRLEKLEQGYKVDVDREVAEDALAPLGGSGWPRGVPWPALIPLTRVGEIRAMLYTMCDTPWVRDMVYSRTLLGLGGVNEGLIRKLEEIIDCHIELSSWGLTLRKPKKMEVCAPKPIVFAVAPLVIYARNMPYNLLVFYEAPGLHANIQTIDAITDILEAMVEKGAALVLYGEAADRIYEDLVSRGLQGIRA